MAIEYAQLRQIVLDYVKSRPQGQVNLMGDNFVQVQARHLELQYEDEDGMRALEIFHELYREGVIVSGSHPRSIGAMEWPLYRVTEYGRKVLETADYVPHDPEGYLAKIKRDVPEIDPAIIRYLEEALGCFKAGHLLAAAVMTGCAAEKAMLLLVEAFGDALGDAEEQQRYKKVVEKQWMISRKYHELWKRLSQKLKQMPEPLQEDLGVILDRVFDLIRSTRNDAGHPAGKIVDRDIVRANFILFPSYCKRIYGLIEHLLTGSL